jgi:hypothetical protein
MMVSFDPMALQQGATALTAKDGVFRGHAATVANLTGLQSAFGEVGAQAWRAIAGEIDRIRRELEAVDDRTTNMGTMMGATGNAATMTDQDHGNAVRNAGR